MKKILIGIGVVLLAVVGYFTYLGMFPKSPPTVADFSDRGLDIQVAYSQPSKRDRLIFGEAAAGALQPYGQYWRFGANAATEITFSKNINFAGQPLNAGSYRVYAVPGAERFKVVLNSELGVRLSAASDANHDLDVLSVDIPVQMAPSMVEKFTISFRSDSVGTIMDCVWDRTLLSIPLTVQQ